MEIGLRLFLLFIGSGLLIAVVWDVMRRKSIGKKNKLVKRNEFYDNSLKRVKNLNEKSKNFINFLSNKIEKNIINEENEQKKQVFEPIISLTENDEANGEANQNYNENLSYNCKKEPNSHHCIDDNNDINSNDMNSYDMNSHDINSNDMNSYDMNSHDINSKVTKNNIDISDNLQTEPGERCFQDKESFNSLSNVNSDLNVFNDGVVEKKTEVTSKMISISVMVKPNTVFTGTKLKEVFELNNLHYGEMNIFHKYKAQKGYANHCEYTNKSDYTSKSDYANNMYANNKDSDSFDKTSYKEPEILFSVVSAVEPGIFDLTTMESEQFSGITLFFVVNNVMSPEHSLDEMLMTAKRLALNLNGVLKDKNYKPLTFEEVDNYKESLKEEVVV